MPPKRNPASIAPPDDRTDPSPSVDQPTLEEYNDLVATHREILRRIQKLEATQAEQVRSSHTSTGPHELRDPKVEPPPEFSGKISKFLNFMAACSLVFTLCPNTYSTHERKVLFVISRLSGMAMSWALSEFGMIGRHDRHGRHVWRAISDSRLALYLRLWLTFLSCLWLAFFSSLHVYIPPQSTLSASLEPRIISCL